MKYRIYPGTLEIIMEAQDGITDLNMLFDSSASPAKTGICICRKAVLRLTVYRPGRQILPLPAVTGSGFT